ncbi:ArsR family transcriptional regulator [Bacillus cereus]
MTQSKLSYHLKILLDAGLIVKETKVRGVIMI